MLKLFYASVHSHSAHLWPLSRPNVNAIRWHYSFFWWITVSLHSSKINHMKMMNVIVLEKFCTCLELWKGCLMAGIFTMVCFILLYCYNRIHYLMARFPRSLIEKVWENISNFKLLTPSGEDKLYSWSKFQLRLYLACRNRILS